MRKNKERLFILKYKPVLNDLKLHIYIYIYIYIYIIQMKVNRGTRIVLDNEGAVTIEYVVKLLCF